MARFGDYCKLLLVISNVGSVLGQMPLNGDPGAFNKMEASLTFFESTVERETTRDGLLFERAIHRMKATEKAEMIQEFIARGSLFLPGEGGDFTSEEPDPTTKLAFNANIGEQIIDPRTPTGFGNPFMRQVRVEQTNDINVLLTDAAVSALREAKQPLKPAITMGWQLVEARGTLNSSYKRFPEFMMHLMASPNKIIRRICESCHVSEFKEIFYKRETLDMITRKTLVNMINGPMEDPATGDDSNLCFTDFTLHSTYQDAVQGSNAWPFCSTANWTYGFPGGSGLTSHTQVQVEKQYNGGSDGQPNFAFYVEDSGFIPITGYGKLHIAGFRYGERIEETNVNAFYDHLYNSANGIVRFICMDCEDPYKDMYYQRITEPTQDLLEILLLDFRSKGGNIINRDFKIFSSYEDALNRTNAWTTCEDSTEKIAFPGRCKPTENSTAPALYWRADPNAIWNRQATAGIYYDIGVYVEDVQAPDTDAWLTEDVEMMNFLYPDSYLKEDEDIPCAAASFDDTVLDPIDPESLLSASLRPIISNGGNDPYAGWYDLQGCGKCNDWCGWFAPNGISTLDGDNPYWKSWTSTDQVFACVSGNSDPAFNYLRESGVKTGEYQLDPLFDSHYIYPEFQTGQNTYAGFLKFFPYEKQKCSQQNDVTPPEPEYRYVGCFKEDTSSRAMLTLHSSSSTIDSCYQGCKSRGLHYFSRQGSGECWCGGASESDKPYMKYGETGTFELPPGQSGFCFPDCVNWSPISQVYRQGSFVEAAFNKAASQCSPHMDFSLSSDSCSADCPGFMSHHSSCSLSRSDFIDLGGYEYKIDLYGTVDGATGGCCTANSCVGGQLRTEDFTFDATTKDGVEYTFFATGGGDWYDVVIALYASSDTNQLNPISTKCYRGSKIDNPVNIRLPISQSGQYFLVFFGGSYDMSGGTVLGASINVLYFAVYSNSRRRLPNIKDSHEDTSIFTKETAEIDTKFTGDDRKLQTGSGFVPATCGPCDGNNIGSGLSCTFQILYTPTPTPSGTCDSIDDRLSVTNDFTTPDTPFQFNFPPNEDPYAGYYDVQRCGTCNDWCGWVGPSMDAEPLDPWFTTETDTHYFTCKLAGGYSGTNGMTERGYFEESFPWQKCEGKGATTPPYRKENYIGCFRDDPASPAFPELVSSGNTIPLYDCADICRLKGFHYFGRQANGMCYCGGTEISDTSYSKYGEIPSASLDYCGDCAGDNIGTGKNCVFQLADQFDIEYERSKHACSHIDIQDLRRYCYVACRDQDESLSTLAACNMMMVMGLQELNRKVEEFADSPMCDTTGCAKKIHPLGKDVGRNKGTF